MMTNVLIQNDTNSISKSFEVWSFDKDELSFIGMSNMKIGYDFTNTQEDFYSIEGLSVSVDLSRLNQHYLQYKESVYLEGNEEIEEVKTLSIYLKSLNENLSMLPLSKIVFEDSIVFNAETKLFTKASHILGIRVKCIVKNTYDYREIILPVYSTIEWKEISIYKNSLEVIDGIKIFMTSDNEFLLTLEQKGITLNDDLNKGTVLKYNELEGKLSFLTQTQMINFKKRLKDFCKPFNMSFEVFMVRYGKDVLKGYDDTKSMIEEMEFLYQSEIVLNDERAIEIAIQFKELFKKIYK